MIDAGAAFEMLQAFALVHDDVMDGSATPPRRPHRPPRVRRPARRRRLAGRGPALRRGRGHPHRRPGPRVRRPAARRRVPVGEGGVGRAARRAQRRPVPRRPRHGPRGDTDHERRPPHRPLQVGQVHDRAAAARRRRPRRAAATSCSRILSAYGDPLGEAFQLRDDLLGAFGEESATGKPVGDDLREGKPTPLLAVADGAADAAQAAVLAEVGQDDLVRDGDRARSRTVFVATGAVATIEATHRLA